jgi:hypothetical protein
MKTLFLSLFLLVVLMPVLAQITENSAIKSLLEKQARAGLARDVDTMIETWANVTYATRLVSLPDSRVIYMTNEKLTQPEQIRKSFSAQPAEASTITHDNYQIRVNGRSAFVTFNSTIKKAVGQKQHAHEVRYLGKMKDGWKVVHVGQVFYTPSAQQAGR